MPPGARFEERRFAGPAGGLTYKVFVPSGRDGETLPVVVMLHGCTQDPDDFALGTRMNALAEEQGLIVVYPRQERAANAQKCWNWFEPRDQGRGAGEPALIAGIAREVVAEFGADPARVYVAGLSAGGAAAAILAAAYPDVFAAAGIHSGLACGAARDLPSALAAMGQGGAAPRRPAGARVPTIVFHGDGDRTVHPLNGERVAAQALPGPGLTETVTRGESPGGIGWTRSVHADAAGRGIVEKWVLHGAGHAWSGGSPDGSYTEPRGPDASAEMLRFFREHARAADPSYPRAVASAPAPIRACPAPSTRPFEGFGIACARAGTRRRVPMTRLGRATRPHLGGRGPQRFSSRRRPRGSCVADRRRPVTLRRNLLRGHRVETRRSSATGRSPTATMSRAATAPSS